MTDLVNPNLTRKGQARRHLIQRTIIEAIADQGLDRIVLTSDILSKQGSVGSFYHVYPGANAFERAIADALTNGNTSQPTSPQELADAIDADPLYWLAVIQGEASVTERGLVAIGALTIRLADWPLTLWQRAIVARWINAASDDPAELAALLDALAPSKSKRSKAA